MIWLFRIFVFAGLLVVLALFSALLIPYLIDWDQFKAEFEAQASRVVGHRVLVGGEPNLRILPLPYISFTDLSVGRNEDGTPLMSIGEFSLQAELFPLLSGKVRIVEMSMNEPHLDLKVAENGIIAWTAPSEAIVDPGQVRIERLVVRNGSMDISGLAGGRRLSIEKLDGVLKAQSVSGPWKIISTAEIEGVETRLNISTGSYRSQLNEMRVRLEATRVDQPYRLLLDGPVKLKNEVLNWDGKFRFEPYSMDEAGIFSAGIKPLAVYTSGTFQASPEIIRVDEYRMEIGARDDPYLVTGDGMFNFRDKVFFRIKVDGRQIDFNRFDETGINSQPIGFEQRLGIVRSFLERIPVPAVNGEIDAVLPAVVAGDTFIRDIAIKVRPFGNGWFLDSFQATFPGNTRIEASGRVGLGEEFGFAGKMLLASRQPSGLSAWLSGDVDARIRRLKMLGFSSNVVFLPNQVIFNDLELRMDDAFLKGKIQRIAPVDERAALIVELRGNRINLQNLQALYSLTQTPDSQDMTSHDLNVRVRTDQLEFMFNDVPVTVGGVNARVRVRDNNILLERFQAKHFYGTSFSGEGKLERIQKNLSGNFKLELSAGDLRQLFGFTGQLADAPALLEKWQSDANLSKDTRLEVELDTRSIDGGTRGQVRISGQTGGSVFSSHIAFEGDISDLKSLPLNGDISVENPHPGQLMEQFGVETFPHEFVDKVFEPGLVNAVMNGSVASGFETRVSLNSWQSGFHAEGKFQFGGGNVVASGVQITLGSENLTPYLQLAGVNLPGVEVSQKLPVSMRMKFDNTDGQVNLRNIDGQISGNTVSGELVYQYSGLRRPRLSGKLALDVLSFPIIGESVFGIYRLIDRHGVIDTREMEFQEPFFTEQDAKLEIKADKFRSGLGIDGTNAQAEIMMLNGAVDINGLSFDALGGKIHSSISLNNAGGLGFGQIRYSLENGHIEDLLVWGGLEAVAEGNINLSGSAEVSGRSLQALISDLSGDGVISVRDVSVRGINPQSLEQILFEVDREGVEIDAASIAAIVDETVLDSQMSVAFLDAPFSIVRGKGGLRNLILEKEKASLIGNLEIDFSLARITASTNITFNPDDRNEIVGAEPQLRISWDGVPGFIESDINTDSLEAYLSLRAFEAAQRRVENLEARVIETQRIQRDIAFSFAREQYRQRKLEEQRRLVEEAARKLHEKQQRLAEEAQQKKANEQQFMVQQNEKKAGQVRSTEPVSPANTPNTGNHILDTIESFLENR